MPEASPDEGGRREGPERPMSGTGPLWSARQAGGRRPARRMQTFTVSSASQGA